MHIKKKIAKGICLVLCALVLSLSITTKYCVPVYAAGGGHSFTISKLYDMALTRTGIVANNSLLQKLQASTLNMLNGTAASYWEYCKANGYDYNQTSWASYLDSEAYTSSGFVLPSWVLQSVYWTDWLFGGDLRGDIMESDVVQMMCGSAVATQGEEYTIKDDVVEYVRDEFDTLVTTEGYGYYYVDTYKPNDFPSDWFGDATSYNNFMTYVKNGENTTFVIADKALANLKFYVLDNRDHINIVKPKPYELTSVEFYHDDWTGYSGKGVLRQVGGTNFGVVDGDTFDEVATTDITYKSDANIINMWHNNNYFSITFIVTKNGEKQIVYTSYEAFKQFSLGNKPYYQTTNNNYDTSSDNSVSFTGDYYNDNSNAYSYDIVQNEIDNSSATTDNSVNNIVNDSSTTIINNYYSSGSGDGSGDGTGDSDTSLGEGIEKLLNGLTKLLDFLLGLLGDLVGLITTFLDSAYNLLSGLTGTFGNFSALLGDMFAFIPQELMDAITAGITLIIVVAVVKAVRK